MFGAAATLAVDFQVARAQEIPPACAQYQHALDACYSDALRFLDLTDPASAAKLRVMEKTQDIAPAIRQKIREVGALKTAEICAAPQFKESALKHLVDIVTPIAMARGDTQACQSAINAIQ
jgi:hypothetical protein